MPVSTEPLVSEPSLADPASTAVPGSTRDSPRRPRSRSRRDKERRKKPALTLDTNVTPTSVPDPSSALSTAPSTAPVSPASTFGSGVSPASTAASQYSSPATSRPGTLGYTLKTELPSLVPTESLTGFELSALTNKAQVDVLRLQEDDKYRRSLTASLQGPSRPRGRRRASVDSLNDLRTARSEYYEAIAEYDSERAAATMPSASSRSGSETRRSWFRRKREDESC